MEKDPVGMPSFLATVYKAMGLDPATHLKSNSGRPIPVVDTGTQPLDALLG